MSYREAFTRMRVLSVVAILFTIAGPLPTVLAQSRPGPRARLLKLDGKYQHVRGMNLAWLNNCYAHDFGRMPEHRDWGIGFNASDLDKYFADMARMNVNVVSILVFESLEGMQFDSNGYVKELDSEMLPNYDTALALAKKHGLHLYLRFGHSYHPTFRNAKVADLICNLKARQAYLDHAVKPFVRRYKGDSRVFAFEIYNEVQFYMEDCTWPVMRSFLRDNATAIHKIDPKRLVTASTGVNELKAGYVSGLGLDFYDIHSYRDDGYLPPVSELNVTLPVIVGEFGPDDAPRPPDEDRQTRAVESFLRNARDGGYAGASYWSYEYPDVNPLEHWLTILRGNGSGEWVPAAYVLRDFNWTAAVGRDPTYLVDLPRTGLVEENGWWSDRGELVLGGLSGNPFDRKPLMFDGKHSAHGIYLHARPSVQASITYRLGKRFSAFRSEVVIPEMFPHQGDPRTPLVFKLVGDGRTIWRSRPLARKGDHQPCSVSVKGIDELSLRVECKVPENWCLTAWVEPQLSLSGAAKGQGSSSR
jgi:hypothetical protein